MFLFDQSQREKQTLRPTFAYSVHHKRMPAIQFAFLATSSLNLGQLLQQTFPCLPLEPY